MSMFRTAALAFVVITVLAIFSSSPRDRRQFTQNFTRNYAMAAVSRSTAKKVLAVETSNGDGVMVRRSIGAAGLNNLTPFLMLEYSQVTKGAGFPDHPHRGQATVTYMLEGQLRHEDSAGHRGTVEAGGVQWMCAGKGILHAEMPVHKEGGPQPRGLQLWIDLPKKFKMADPTYQEFGPEQIPEAFPQGPEGPVKVRVVSGISHGVESPVRPLGGCWYFHYIFKDKATIFQDIPPEWTSFVYIIKGGLTIGSESVRHKDFYTIVFSANKNETGVSITAEPDTEFILVAGEPLDQTVFQYGPFVMTTREEIQKTLLDYQMAQNGFEKAHSWKSKIAHE